jgi:hypothetical protein
MCGIAASFAFDPRASAVDRAELRTIRELVRLLPSRRLNRLDAGGQPLAPARVMTPRRHERSDE